MDDSVQPQTDGMAMEAQDAWQMVLSQLRGDLSRALFETWVEPLRPLGYHNRTFVLGAANTYARDWVDSRIKSRVTQLLEGLYRETLIVQVTVSNHFYQPQEDALTAGPVPAAAPVPSPAAPSEAPAPTDLPASSSATNRKLMLQRAYGSRRAAVIQPERGMFVTLYFFNNWLPVLGHSAAIIILAARSMCYWNPLTGELRNTIETEMAEIARRAAVSVRTVKDVLNTPVVQNFFLRYKVRRVMTPNGVRTAGIVLQVRMDDPLTPEDQVTHNLPEDQNWFTPDFASDDEEDG
jgi:hypothetical protein